MVVRTDLTASDWSILGGGEGVKYLISSIQGLMLSHDRVF